MPEIVNEPSSKQEQETRPRHIRIGLMGPIGAGKTTLGELLGEKWGAVLVEEDFGDNPFLEDFYKYPEENSFKSQRWFLERKIEQLAGLTSQTTEIIDPALGMDFLYAKVQHEIGWMTQNEWQRYQRLYYTLAESSQIREPDIVVVVNAPVNILAQRIRKRGRAFELWMLDEKPEYFKKLQSTVSSWLWDKSDSIAIIPVDSHEIDYFNRIHHRDIVVDHVEDWMNLHLQNFQRRGTVVVELILPTSSGEK